MRKKTLWGCVYAGAVVLFALNLAATHPEKQDTNNKYIKAAEMVTSTSVTDATATPSVSVAPLSRLYSVTFDSQGGTGVPAITDLVYASTITLPSNPKKTGFWFRGWFTDAACTQIFSATTAIKEDLTLYAKWEPKEDAQRDIMSFQLQSSSISAKMTADFTDQIYGYRLQPSASELQPRCVTEAVKAITGYPAPLYFAFQLDVQDFSFQTQKPLPISIVLPSYYAANNVAIYYTPNGRSIDGACQGVEQENNVYTFSAYANGYYIVMTKSHIQPVATSASSNIQPYITMSAPKKIQPNQQESAVILFHNFDTSVVDTSNIKFKWSTSNKAIATVDQEGVITGIKKGSCTITAISLDEQYTASVKITVANKTTKTSLPTLQVKPKQKKKISTKNILTTAARKKAVFKSANTKIATVSKKGVVTGKKVGTTTCTVRYNKKIVYKIKIIVKK